MLSESLRLAALWPGGRRARVREAASEAGATAQPASSAAAARARGRAPAPSAAIPAAAAARQAAAKETRQRRARRALQRRAAGRRRDPDANRGRGLEGRRRQPEGGGFARSRRAARRRRWRRRCRCADRVVATVCQTPTAVAGRMAAQHAEAAHLAELVGVALDHRRERALQRRVELLSASEAGQRAVHRGGGGDGSEFGDGRRTVAPDLRRIEPLDDLLRAKRWNRTHRG